MHYQRSKVYYGIDNYILNLYLTYRWGTPVPLEEYKDKGI